MTKKTAEDWAKEKQTADWQFGAAKAMQRWGTGKELSEAEYQAAIEEAGNAKMTAGNPFTGTAPDVNDANKPQTVITSEPPPPPPQPPAPENPEPDANGEKPQH